MHIFTFDTDKHEMQVSILFSREWLFTALSFNKNVTMPNFLQAIVQFEQLLPFRYILDAA